MIKQCFLLLGCLTLPVYSTSYVNPCSGISKGIYCLNGLIGYKDCTKDNYVFNPCPPFQMCQCGLNRKCEENQPLCGYKNPPPEIPRTFMVQFHGKGILHTANSNKPVTTTGVVYQDGSEQRLRIQTKLHYGTDVKVIEELHVKDPSSALWIKVSISMEYPEILQNSLRRSFSKQYDVI